MGIFGRVKTFLFETESQRAIKSELEKIREQLDSQDQVSHEAWGKLLQHSEYMQAKAEQNLTRLDEHFEFHTKRIDGVQRIITERHDNLESATHERMTSIINALNDIVEIQIKPLYTALSTHDEAVKDLIVAFFRDVFQKLDELPATITSDNLSDKLSELQRSVNGIPEVIGGSAGDVLNRIDGIISNMTNIEEVIKDKIDKHDENTKEDLIAGLTAVVDKCILPSIKSNANDILEKLDEAVGSMGNIEEVITNPKPHSDLMDMVTSVQKSVEHINGFLNDEEYKQQWDMKQVTGQLVKVQVLLEAVEALLPTPSGDTQTKILEMFASTDYAYLSPKRMMDELGLSKKQVYSALARMCKNGTLVLLGRGQYALPNVGERLAGDADEARETD